MRSGKSGQSLAELLIGIGLAAAFMIGAATVIAPALQTNKAVSGVQAEAQFNNELSRNVLSWSTSNWSLVAALATSSANQYYLNSTSSPFTAVAGTQTSTINGLLYQRYFYINSMYRDASGNATSSASSTYDPSTLQITVVVLPQVNGSWNASAAISNVFLITRNTSNVFNQTSWGGGSGQTSSVKLVGTTFANSTSVVISASGTIQLLSSTSSCTL